jgi:hypothetical protein
MYITNLANELLAVINPALYSADNVTRARALLTLQDYAVALKQAQELLGNSPESVPLLPAEGARQYAQKVWGAYSSSAQDDIIDEFMKSELVNISWDKCREACLGCVLPLIGGVHDWKYASIVLHLKQIIREQMEARGRI